MLERHIYDRIRLRWIKIFAVILTTIIILTAAGLDAAAFSSTKQKRSVWRSSAPMPVAACASQPSGMVGWWPGNGNANDIINGNNGQVINGASYAQGNVGQAFSFNQAAQQYIDVPGAASYLLNNNAGTISVWVNPSAVGDNDMIVAFGTGNNGEGVGIGVYGTVRIYHHTATFDWQTATPVSPNTWTYLVYTWDGTTETLYKNGVFAESRARNFNYVPGNSRFGYGFWNDPANFFPGEIDEVAIFNRTLNGAEIAAMHNAGSAGVCPNCAPPPTGLANWWPAEGNANDIYGAKNAALFNGAGYVPGRVGQAFDFDGVDDHAVVPASSDWAFGTGDFTVEFWMYSSTNDTHRPIVNNRATPASDSIWAIEVYQVANRVEFHSGLTIFLTATNLLVPLSWNHVAVTRSGTTLSMYINGVPSGTASNATNFSSVNALQVGRDIMSGNDLGGNSFQGQIDELSIYRNALTPPQVATIYNAGSGGKCSTCTPAPVGLRSWWTGDGNGLDSRGVNNGTMQNGAVFAPGKVGQAFSFDGSGQHVAIPDSANLHLINGVTLAGWFMFNTSTPQAALISKPYQTGMSNAYVMWIQNGHLYGSFGGSYLGNYFAPVPGRWYYIAYTYDPTTAQNYIYLDGEQFASAISNGTPAYDPAPLLIGMDSDDGMPALMMDGKADEVGIYDRALTQAEIRELLAAGNLGICRPTAMTPPPGLVSWWGGDGDGRTLSGSGYNALLYNGADFRVGKVGQAYNFDGVNDYAEIVGGGYDPGAAEFSVDLWIKPRVSEPVGTYLIGKSHPDGGMGWDIRLDANRIELVGVNGWAINMTSDPVITINAWHHIAMSSTATTVSLYINGVLSGTCPRSAISGSPNPLRIGFTTNFGGRVFDGLMDEIDFFDRAITAAEVAGIYNAGLAGKVKQDLTTPPAMKRSKTKRTSVSTNVTVGDATVMFPAVTAAGMTQQIPLDPATLPPLPLRPVGLTYDIATSARYTGTPTVCFNLTSFNYTEFATLHILHLENGGWVDRTAGGSVYPSLCSEGLTTLSPFAIVTTAPTAAELSIAGRVVTDEGRGIRGAFVTVTATDGNARTVPTGNLGRYTVEGLAAGGTYIVTVRSRRFTFAQPTRVITLNDNVTDADFTGSAGTGRDQ